MPDDSSRLETTIRDAIDPTRVLQQVVDEALRLIDGAEGAAILFAEPSELTYVCGTGMFASAVGISVPKSHSFAGLAVELGTTLLCDDARSDPRVDSEAVARTGAVSAVCVPLVHDRRTVGALLVTASRPGVFGAWDEDVLTHLAGFISATIATASQLNRITVELLGLGGGEGPVRSVADRAAVSRFVANVLRPGASRDMERRERVEKVLRSNALRTLFQPVVDVVSDQLTGVEALTRFDAEPRQGPDVWFSDAYEVGLGVELEVAAVREACRHIDELPQSCYVAINLGPLALESEEVFEVLDSVDPRRIVIELTEHMRVSDYPALRRILAQLRQRGLRLAIDDTGAGFASLSHIVQLAPDIIKLDLDLTRGIDADPVRRSLATALVAFAADTGALVIAEGIETKAELETLRDLGIGYGQGFLLGRPDVAEAVGACVERVAHLTSA